MCDRFLEHKEVLVFFPQDFTASIINKCKVEEGDLTKPNSWVTVNFGQEGFWKGVVIKSGKSNTIGINKIAENRQ